MHVKSPDFDMQVRVCVFNQQSKQIQQSVISIDPPFPSVSDNHPSITQVLLVQSLQFHHSYQDDSLSLNSLQV